MATNKYSIINNEMFIYELDAYVIDNVPSSVEVIYVQEEKFDEYKQLNPTLPLAKKNYLLMGIHQPVWYEDYQRVMELPDIASPELSFSESEVEVDVYEVPCNISLQTVTNPHNVDVVYSVDGVEVLDPSACEISTDGSHTITASFAGSELYYAASVSYTIAINIVEDTMDISFANSEVSVSSYLDETWTGQLQPVSGAPQGATIVYSCEGGVIANGLLTLPSAGTYTVNVEVSATHYTTATASYDIVYTQDYRTMNISFAVDSVGVTGNQKEAYIGTVQSVTGAPQGATIVYSCSDANVTISGTSIEIADEGTYTITATVSANYYNTATASYSIVYSQNDLVMNLSFANSAISETLTEGDGYEAQVQTVNGAPSGATVVYSTSAGSISNGTLTVSNISDGDSVTVSATVSCPDYVTTTISYTISFTVQSQKSNLDVYFAQYEFNYGPHGVNEVEPILGIPNDYDGTITWDCSTDEVNWTPVQNDLIGDTMDAVVYVRATLPDTSLYNGTQIQYTVTRWTDWSTILWEGTGITSTTFYFDNEDNPSFPVSVTPIDAPTTNGVSVDSITSSDTSILEVDSNTGEWILKQEGTVTMTATVNDVIQHDYRMCGDTKDLTVTIGIVSGRVETQFMQSSASDVNMIEYVESDLTQSQLPYTITISDVYLQTTQGDAVTLSDSSLIVHDCGPDFSFNNDNNEVTYTAWQLSDMVQATLTFKGDATYKPCSATVYIELNEVLPIEFSNSSESATIRASQSSTTVNLQGLNNVPSEATVSYSCGNYTVNVYENIYYIDNMTAGTYTVSATVTMNGNTIGTDSYTLTVSQTQPTTAVLEFYDSNGDYFGSAVEYDVSNANIALPHEVRIYDVTGDTTNPYDVMPVSQQDAVFTWSSDAAGVADIGVDENTGDTMIFLYGEGTANITCTWAGNSTYPNGAEKSFELTVTDANAE